MKSRIAILLFFPLFLNAALPAFAFEKGEGMHRELSENTGTKSGTVTSCQARQAEVKNRMTHLTQLATNMQNVFDRTATRVENYYTTKVVPSGKTVPNYSSLVAVIATQKAAVTTALTTAQNDANSFTCDGSTTPKAQTAKFRTDMQAVKQALKNYRISIKNLIVAVHSVTGKENEASESAHTK